MQITSSVSCKNVLSDKVTKDGVISWQLVFDEVVGGKVRECSPLKFLCLQQELVDC
jgi:hypothetical protein